MLILCSLSSSVATSFLRLCLRIYGACNTCQHATQRWQGRWPGAYFSVLEPLRDALAMVLVLAWQHDHLLLRLKLHAADCALLLLFLLPLGTAYTSQPSSASRSWHAHLWLYCGQHQSFENA